MVKGVLHLTVASLITCCPTIWASNDAELVNEALAIGIAEIHSAYHVIEQSTNDETKAIAQESHRFYSAFTREIAIIASQSSIPMAEDIELAQRAKKRAVIVRNYSDTDLTYATSLVSNCRDALQLFLSYAGSSPQGMLNSFAAQAIPSLQHQLQKSEHLQASLRNQHSGNSPPSNQPVRKRASNF